MYIEFDTSTNYIEICDLKQSDLLQLIQINYFHDLYLIKLKCKMKETNMRYE